MSIRAMTADEIRAALRHGAQVCVERQTAEWWTKSVTTQDDAWNVALGYFTDGSDAGATSHDAATFLLLVAEAL